MEDRLNRRICRLQSEIQVLYELISNFTSLVKESKIGETKLEFDSIIGRISVLPSISNPMLNSPYSSFQSNGITSYTHPSGFMQPFPSLKAAIDRGLRVPNDQILSGTFPLKRSVLDGRKTPKPKKRRGNLPAEATTILKSWLFDHKEKPYPSEEEKGELVKLTGLTIVQINYWFSNARRRILKRDASTNSD